MYLLTDTDGYQYHGDPYILDLIPVSSGLATISTDQKLCLFDPRRLSNGPKLALQTSHGNITAVKALDASGCVLATAGENGTIAIWDLRDGTPQVQRTAPAGGYSFFLLDMSTRTVEITIRFMFKSNMVMRQVHTTPCPARSEVCVNIRITLREKSRSEL